ncbi:MAG: hypothetical protein MJK12_16685 [Colwellia sp.]|nr:hypothetical protein [Colwellia sp.]
MDKLLVDVRQRYKSSTRIDGQLDDSKVFIDNFILHGTAINVLETISRDFEGSEQRAYSITGPYGSGKSTIALFLSLLLSTNKDERDYAEDSLDCAEGLKSEFPNRFKINKGWKVVKHVCAMESPAHALLLSIASSLKVKLNKSDLCNLTDNECLDRIKELLNAKSIKEDGVLILLDEMGKALDYCSNENKDLYIFQQLADIAQQSDNQIILISFLHQPFTEYAKNKDSKLQEDWAKVQGRYRDLGYNPSVDESLFLLGDAISKSSDEIDKQLIKQHQNSVEVVNNSFKSKTRNASDLFKTLPLDPLVSLLLGPISRRRFSQNERSLFGFLASHEKYGFREFLADNYEQGSKLNELYSADNLWGYLHHNLYHIIVTSPDSKAWLESCDAIDRATRRGTNLHSSIAKVIALLTLFGFNQHFHAAKKFLLNYFECKGHKKREIESSLDDLEKWTVVIFRSAHNGYFIFEGSDIDINSLIKNQKEKLESGIDWTSVCDVSTSILATSHYHKTGTMRWANKLIVNTVDSQLFNNLAIEPIHGKSFLNFVIPTNDNAFSQLSKLAADNKYIVVGKSQSLIKLKDIAIELIALEKARKEEDIVVRDKIALRELDSRIITSKQALSNELDLVFLTSTWSYQTKELSKQPLSSVASFVANLIFSKAPTIINELINKAKPSGSANAGIRKLLKSMAEESEEAALNLPEKTFPAEKGLYYSSLVNFGLHGKDKEDESKIKFSMPSNDNPKLKGLFEETLDFISDNSGIIKISELVDLWSKEPYGLAKGVIPIWLLALLQANRHQLAFYDFNGVTNKSTFINGADGEFALKLLQQPELLGIQYVKVDHSTTNYLNEVAQPFMCTVDEISPLVIAQALVAFYSKLSPWTRNTRTLSKELLKFKDVTKVASDPNDYLLNELPKVFGKNKSIDDIKSTDISSIKEQLEKAHEKELLKFESRIRGYITFSDRLVKNCKKVATFTTNPKVETFALRLSEFANNNKWVSSIISLLSGKAERNWDDNAISKANSELIEIITRFKQDLLLSDFGDIEYKTVNKKYRGELKEVSNSISKLDKAEQQAVLLTMLEDLMEA